MTHDSNPYQVPSSPEIGPPLRFFVWRLTVLALPLVIPLLAHIVSRTLIPPDDSPYHAMFTLGAILPVWVCARFMPDRFLLSARKTYEITSIVLGAAVAVVLLSYTVT